MQVAGRNTLGVSDVVKTLTIQCEAADCRALLQVGVPSSHASNPVIIVKCGNCSRLLEVRLDAGQQGTAQRPGSSQGGTGSRAAATQALEWGSSDAMEGPRGSSGGLAPPQQIQQRSDPKEDASRIIEDILTRNTEEEGPRGGPASGRRGDHHPGFGRAAYSTAPMFSQQPMSRSQPQHSRGLPEMQLHRGGREQYMDREGYPGSPPQRTAAQQQTDSFGRYQQRYHEQPQQQQQQHAHGHGMAAHARSPEGPSPGARAAALAFGQGAGLRLQSPEGLLAHAHMSTLDSPPRPPYAASTEHQYQLAAQQQQHPQQLQRALFQQQLQQQQGRHPYSQFEAGRYFLPPDELAPRSRSDAREMAAQSPPEDVWGRVPGRAGGQMSGQPSGQPGAFRGFDFTSERSMLHAHELSAGHAEPGGRKRPAEQSEGGGGGRGGTRGPLLDPKAVLGGQGWKLQRVRSLGSLPSDEALLAQAARWPDRRSRPRQEAEPSQLKPGDEGTKGAQAEATVTQTHSGAPREVPTSTPMPAARHQAIDTGQERSAEPGSRAPQPPLAAAAVPASTAVQDPPPATAGTDPPASTSADPPVPPPGSGLQPLRIEPLNLDAAAGEAEPFSNLISSHIQAGGHQDEVGTAGNTASPLSHGSLNAFNPFEGGSDFTLSPLRRGGDHRGDTAGGQGSPAAHSGYSPFGMVADLGFTPDH